MRSKLVVLVTVALLVIPSAVALGEDSNPFKGSWVGIDDTDGSRNMLIVGGGNNHVVYRETGITACFRAFDEFVGGSAAGFATIDGNELTFTGTLYCNLEEGRTAHPGLSDFVWVVAYDSLEDTVSLELDTTVLSRLGG
jgi:hypothetical protein